METIPMHNPGQAKQSQDRQKPGKNQAGVTHPSSVQIHPSPIVESHTTHLIANPYRPGANPPLSYIGIPDDSPRCHVTDRNERCLLCWVWVGTIRIPGDPPPRHRMNESQTTHRSHSNLHHTGETPITPITDIQPAGPPTRMQLCLYTNSSMYHIWSHE